MQLITGSKAYKINSKINKTIILYTVKNSFWTTQRETNSTLETELSETCSSCPYNTIRRLKYNSIWHSTKVSGIVLLPKFRRANTNTWQCIADTEQLGVNLFWENKKTCSRPLHFDRTILAAQTPITRFSRVWRLFFLCRYSTARSVPNHVKNATSLETILNQS